MDRLFSRLERRFGRYAVANLSMYLAAGSALVFVLSRIAGRALPFLLALDPARVLGGEVWRLVTWVFIPAEQGTFLGMAGSDIFMMFIYLQFLWISGSMLEGTVGAFRVNAYYLTGALLTVAASMASGLPMPALFLNGSLFLALATVAPDAVFMLFFVIPVAAKWLGLMAAGLYAYAAYTSGWGTRAAVFMTAANYLLFFRSDLARALSGGGANTVARRKVSEPVPITRPARKCVLCGKSDDEPGADLRVCTCKEVCQGKATVYCLEHARSHLQPGGSAPARPDAPSDTP